MKTRSNIFLLSLLIITGIIALAGGCIAVTGPATQTKSPSQATVPSAPQFGFGPIQISALPVTVNKPFTITMKISNAGTAPGSYKADLYIDGSLADSQMVAVNAGQSTDASFQSMLQVPGSPYYRNRRTDHGCYSIG